MIPNQADLAAALRKVRTDLPRWAGAVSAELKYHLGKKPVIIVTGNVANRPAEMPKAIRSFADAAVYPILILWHAPADPRASMPILQSTAEDDIPLNDAMWAGAPVVEDHSLKMLAPGGHQPDTPIAQPVPTTPQREYQFAASARLPQFATPNFWAKPFHKSGNICCPFYERLTPVLSFQVPTDYLLVISGLSYEFSDLVVFDQFTIHVLRNGNDLGHFLDMKASNTPDPAEQYLFGGHYRPFPFYGRFDHDERMTIAVTVHGPWPFTKTNEDRLGGCVTVNPQGWLGSLYDIRDGGARPVDMGELNDIFLGEPSNE